jgi:hypothetical protein
MMSEHLAILYFWLSLAATVVLFARMKEEPLGNRIGVCTGFFFMWPAVLLCLLVNRIFLRIFGPNDVEQKPEVIKPETKVAKVSRIIRFED